MKSRREEEETGEEFSWARKRTENMPAAGGSRKGKESDKDREHSDKHRDGTRRGRHKPVRSDHGREHSGRSGSRQEGRRRNVAGDEVVERHERHRDGYHRSECEYEYENEHDDDYQDDTGSKRARQEKEPVVGDEDEMEQLIYAEWLLYSQLHNAPQSVGEPEVGGKEQQEEKQTFVPDDTLPVPGGSEDEGCEDAVPSPAIVEKEWLLYSQLHTTLQPVVEVGSSREAEQESVPDETVSVGCGSGKEECMEEPGPSAAGLDEVRLLYSQLPTPSPSVVEAVGSKEAEQPPVPDETLPVRRGSDKEQCVEEPVASSAAAIVENEESLAMGMEAGSGIHFGSRWSGEETALNEDKQVGRPRESDSGGHSAITLESSSSGKDGDVSQRPGENPCVSDVQIEKDNGKVKTPVPTPVSSATSIADGEMKQGNVKVRPPVQPTTCISDAGMKKDTGTVKPFGQTLVTSPRQEDSPPIENKKCSSQEGAVPTPIGPEAPRSTEEGCPPDDIQNTIAQDVPPSPAESHEEACTQSRSLDAKQDPCSPTDRKEKASSVERQVEDEPSAQNTDSQAVPAASDSNGKRSPRSAKSQDIGSSGQDSEKAASEESDGAQRSDTDQSVLEALRRRRRRRRRRERSRSSRSSVSVSDKSSRSKSSRSSSPSSDSDRHKHHGGRYYRGLRRPRRYWDRGAHNFIHGRYDRHSGRSSYDWSPRWHDGYGRRGRFGYGARGRSYRFSWSERPHGRRYDDDQGLEFPPPRRHRFDKMQSHSRRSDSREEEDDSRYHKYGGGSSGLGGYSPRRRRSRDVTSTPSPPTRSPERKKSRAWDLPPVVGDAALTQQAQQGGAVQNTAAGVPVPLPSTPFGAGNPLVVTALQQQLMVPVVSLTLTQATRSIRRLYAGNVPSTVSDGEFLEFMNAALLSANINSIPGTKPCISCTVHPEKNYAFAEFISPEDTTAALAFDGVMLHGTVVKLRRPKDYVHPVNLPTIAAPNLVSNVVPDSPRKIFLGGIASSLSPEKVKEIVTSFGQLKAFHCEVVLTQFPPKRYVYFEYLDPDVTLKACAGLNGLRLANNPLTCVQATPDVLSQSRGTPFYGIPEAAVPLLEPPTRIVELHNLVSEEEFLSMSEEEVAEYIEDIKIECSRFGTIKAMHITRPKAPSGMTENQRTTEDESNGIASSCEAVDGSDSSQQASTLRHTSDTSLKSWGQIFVEYGREEYALVAATSLHGRLYGGRKVVAGYFPAQGKFDSFTVPVMWKETQKPDLSPVSQVLALT